MVVWVIAEDHGESADLDLLVIEGLVHGSLVESEPSEQKTVLIETVLTVLSTILSINNAINSILRHI